MPEESFTPILSSTYYVYCFGGVYKNQYTELDPELFHYF